MNEAMNEQTRQNIHNASQAYFKVVAEQVPTEAELTGWLAKISENVSPAICEKLRSLGPVANWLAEPYYISFRNYVAENRCLQYLDFLAEHLSMADFDAYLESQTDENGEPTQILRILAQRPERQD